MSAWSDPDGAVGGGFMILPHGDPRNAELEAQYWARVRARIGDQEADRMRRSMALGRNPRPLSVRQAAILWEAVAPLLRDMEATGQALPDIRAEAHADRGAGIVCAWIRDPGGTGQGISVLPPGQRGDQLYDLAEQLQAWASEVQADQGRRPWPDCPAHPGAHRLEPETVGETAVWSCPQTLRVVAEIGALGSPVRGVPRVRSRKQQARRRR